jgi:hypothetical protein
MLDCSVTVTHHGSVVGDGGRIVLSDRMEG